MPNSTLAFHPDEVTFELDIELTVQVSALISDDMRSYSVKVGDRWVSSQSLPEEAQRLIEETALELHADAGYEKRQQQMFPQHARN